MREEPSSQTTVETGGIPVESIHEQVQRILSSRRFAGSERHCRLLRYLLEQTLDGRAGRLKECVLAIEVFDRRDSFDPQTDPIVRTELSRLRAKLRDYYEADGRSDALIIDLPNRSYSLTFQSRGSGNGAPFAGPSDEIGAPAANAAKTARFSLSVSRVAFATLAIFGLAGFWALVRAHNRPEPQPRLNHNLTSVAVLPFVNLSADPESEHFSVGLAEEIIHRLGGMDGVRVVSRTSSSQFKGEHEDLRTIASQLNAELVLEGAVRRSDRHLRATTRLVRASDGYELWSHADERAVEDILALQSQTARQVASALLDASSKRYTNSELAFDLYLQGRYQASKGSEVGLKRAIHCFEQAIAADPNYAPAHASLADAYVLLALRHEAPPAEAMLRAKDAAHRAVETHNDFAPGHSALGSVLSLHHWDWTGAEKEFSKAIELDPNDASIRMAYAMRCLLPQGRLDSALFELQLAQELDPFSPRIAWGLARSHYFMRDPDRAIKTFQAALQLDPRFEATPLALAKAYVQKSLFGEALSTLREASGPTEAEARLAVLAHAYALGGQPDRARNALERLQEVARQQYISGFYFALIHVALNEEAKAIDWLEKAADQRCPLIVHLKVSPMFDTLRTEPRFVALLKKVGLSG